MSEKNLSRRDFLKIAAAGSTAGLVAGAVPALAESSASPPQQDRVTVTFMVPGSQQEDADFAPVFEAFAEMYPEIDAQYTPAGTGYNAQYDEKLLTLLAAGTAPDVFKTLFGKFGAFGALGVYTPLDDYVDAYPELTQFDDFFANHIEGCRINGQLMALPNDGAPEGIWYNVDLFDAAGQAYPDWDWTWDTLTDAAKELTVKDGAITVQHGVGQPFWLETIWSNGGEILDEEGTKCLLDQPEAVEALTWMQELTQVHQVTPSPEALAELAQGDRFSTGRLGMFYAVRGTLGGLRTIEDFRFDAAPMVMSNKGTRVTRLLIGWTSVWSGSAHPDEAYKLTAWVASPEGQRLRISNGFAHPSRKSLVEQDWYRNYQCDMCNSTNVNNVFPEMLLREEARAWPAYPKEAEILQVITTELDHLWDGSKTAAQVAQDATAAIDAIVTG
jgi:multiple sugar transport system substrate-binding protein